MRIAHPFVSPDKRALGATSARIKYARNNGSKRTPAKRALLKAVEDEGRRLPFTANF